VVLSSFSGNDEDNDFEGGGGNEEAMSLFDDDV
jgi:hypothetical protein